MISAFLISSALLLSEPAPAGDANAALDRQVFEALKELNNKGADLNNSGDPIGCYRLYQGGIVMLRSLVGHRPAAQKVIDEGLKAAEKRSLPERAFSLHTTITELRAMFKGVAAPAINDQNKGPVPVPSGELPKPVPLPPTSPPPVSFKE